MAPRPAAGSQTLGGSCSVRMSAVTAGAGVSYKSRPRSACVRRWTCVEWSSIGLRATPVSLPCEVDLGRLGQRLRVESSRQLDTRGFDVDRGGELGEHLVELGPAVDEWLLGVGHISPSGCE